MERNQIYKCSVCGNIVEVLFVGGGTLVCCGQPMELQTEKQQDAGSEKHVPVIEKTDKGILVKIGFVPHPMEKAHYIEWIELAVDGKRYKEFLKPNNPPEAEFCVNGENLQARTFCNIHGLWKN
jgi:superoxide reductase